MNNKNFIAELSRRIGRSVDETQMLTYSLVDSMNEAFQDGDAVVVNNFGTFEVKKRMERVMVSPTTKRRCWCRPNLCLPSNQLHPLRKNLKVEVSKWVK